MSNVNGKLPSSPTPTIVIQQFGKLLEDYQQSKSKSDVQSSSSVPQQETLVRPFSETLCDKSLGVSQAHPVLAKLAGTTEIASELREKLLQIYSGPSKRELADYKHIYNVSSNNFTTAQQSYSLTSIAGGVASNTRITNALRLRKLRLHVRIATYSVGNNTITQLMPTLHLVLYRDKLPITPGTAPTVFAVDANPPQSSTAMFSQLGIAAPVGIDNAVRNPMTERDFHIYKKWRIDRRATETVSNTDPAIDGFLPFPTVRHETIDVDLNGVQQIYATYAATNSEINNVWLSFQAASAYSANQIDTLSIAADVEFEDIQD